MGSRRTIAQAFTANTGPRWLVCAVLLAAGTAGAQAREQVTLEQAIDRAWKNLPQMVQARGNQEVARAAQRSAFGNYLPSLTAKANTSFNDNAPGANPWVRSGAGAGLSLSYDLFTGFRRRAQSEQADAQADSADASLIRDRASVALDVERTFYENLRARELEQVAQARVARAQEGIDAAARKSKAGSGTRSDELRAALELNTAKRSVLDAHTQSEIAAYALGRLIGADGAVDARADLNAKLALADVDEGAFVNDVVQQSPDVRAAEAALRSAQAGVGVARSQYLPQVGLGAGYDWGIGTGVSLPGDTGWNVSVGLTYPLFDGFQRDQASTQARVQQSVAAATLNDARRAARATAEQYLGALKLARDQIALAEQSVGVAEEDLRMQQERYRLGVSTMLDLLTSQAAVVEAQNNLVAARFDYRLAWATLQALAGRTP